MKLRILTSLLSLLPTAIALAAQPSPESVQALGQKVADWQINTFEHSKDYRALSSWKKKKLAEGKIKIWEWNDLAWHKGTLYAGMDQFRRIAKQPQKYTDWLTMMGEQNEWKLHARPYNADDHTVGQFYLSLYQEFGDKAMLQPTLDRFDWILDNPKTGSLEWSGYGKDKHRTDCHYRWGWCDALFMAPPVWARLAKVTGEQKYLDFMDQEYHATYDALWDNEDKLFWRDTSYFPKREKNGSKLYWARGNGWVYGGLALMIPDLPTDWEGRQFYIDLFKEMSVSIKHCQRDDGTWSMGLLGGVEGYPIKEASGTSFFTFGLAWGINNGILDRATYEPIALRAWAALEQCVTPEGMLGYVQPVGAAPGDSFPDKTEIYGIGAFLAASAEVYKLVGGEVKPLPAQTKTSKPQQTTPKKPTTRAHYNRSADPHTFTIFMREGGWCWFQDPRAIVHNDTVFIGSVKGTGAGEALIGAYDLSTQKMVGNFTAHPNFNRDDHNSPVFIARPDGSLLTTYAKHNHNKLHYSRILDFEDPMQWGNEFTHERTSPNKQDRVTYMNLYTMKDEGLLYNFYRGINFNPTFVTSPDYGKTWSEPVHLVANEVGGRHRPYARYAGNGTNTVHLSITDAHPRNYGNSIYYAALRDGRFYRADGSQIKPLSDGPLRPSETERIYKGSNTETKPKGHDSVPGAAWTSAVELDSSGRPHIGYTVHHSNHDHRYRLASWDGHNWIDREIAYAGKCLYPSESSYTGLVTMDPINPELVFISTNVNPATGEDLGGKHEIYRAKIGPHDDITTLTWEAVTQDSPVLNIRPMILRNGDQRIVLWQRGDYVKYTDYQLDTVGLIEQAH